MHNGRAIRTVLSDVDCTVGLIVDVADDIPAEELSAAVRAVSAEVAATSCDPKVDGRAMALLWHGLTRLLFEVGGIAKSRDAPL